MPDVNPAAAAPAPLSDADTAALDELLVTTLPKGHDAP